MRIFASLFKHKPLQTLCQYAQLIENTTVQNLRCFSLPASQESIPPLQIKKRPVRKRRPFDEKEPGAYQVIAYATADEYDLEDLAISLKNQDLYTTSKVENSSDVLHALAKYQVDKEPREIFFFREGTVVLWNMSDLESGNLINFIKPFEQDPYSEKLVQGECETMNYQYQVEGKPSMLELNGNFVIPLEQNLLDKYTFSNSLALSVKLGIWEAMLDKYIDSIEYVTDDLKMGKKIKMTREEVLRKHGELFALRHLINLSSDLLDTPDFYWDQDQYENLYVQTCNYFNINRRTKVMNEKLNHCIELVELLSSHLSDRHHIRLEWMIIILIMVEVAFETIHYLERYLS